MTSRIIGWRSIAEPGAERATVSFDPFRVQGVVAGADDGAAFALRYELACGDGFVTRSLRVEVAGGPSLLLERDDLGRDGGGWRRDGVRAPDLDGCMDVDLSATPLTNTLPIRRLGAGRHLVRVAWVRAPDLAVVAAEQAYERIGAGLWRFETVPPDFRADISVDADGLVVDYPGLFARIVA